MNSAVFVDFENLYLSLKHRSEATGLRTRELAIQILEGLMTRLRENGTPMVLGRSYAAFDTYPGVEVAHDLALMGMEPQYVLISHTGKNSADVQLALDVARVVFKRPEIEQVVIVSGDRDFIPLARQVLEENRELRVVAIPDTTSGDLRARVGGERFWNALDLLPNPPPAVEPKPKPTSTAKPAPEPIEIIPAPEPTQDAASPIPVEVADADPGDDGPGCQVVGHIPVTWQTGGTSEEGALEQCLELLIRARQRHGSRDIWLSPFLKGPMSQHFNNLVHPERRALINELRARGIIKVEERENQYADYPYSVIVIEDEHPMAREAVGRLGARV